VVLIELLLISVIRYKFMHTPLLRTIGQVIFGGGVVFGIGLWLGQFGAA
jgi:erythrin-vacuolar iron transport family protein